jgi:hypothetical protein
MISAYKPCSVPSLLPFVLFVVRVFCMLFYLFTYAGVQQNFYRYPCYLTVTRVTQVVRFVEQKLLILMEQSSSPSF